MWERVNILWIPVRADTGKSGVLVYWDSTLRVDRESHWDKDRELGRSSVRIDQIDEIHQRRPAGCEGSRQRQRQELSRDLRPCRHNPITTLTHINITLLGSGTLDDASCSTKVGFDNTCTCWVCEAQEPQV